MQLEADLRLFHLQLAFCEDVFQQFFETSERKVDDVQFDLAGSIGTVNRQIYARPFAVGWARPRAQTCLPSVADVREQVDAVTAFGMPCQYRDACRSRNRIAVRLWQNCRQRQRKSSLPRPSASVF